MRHAELPGVWHLNRVQFTGPGEAIAAPAAIALAERHLADLAHRRIVIDDAACAPRISAPLQAAGFTRTRVRWMALRDEPTGRGDPRARLLTEAELVAVQRLTHAELAGDCGRAAPLLAGQAALRASTRALGFGAGEPGELVCTATLFCADGGGGQRVALIDEVVTLRAHRQQGLGRAVVDAAIRAARDWGADLVALATDAEDWPQLMYVSLGFVPLGEQLIFDRRVRLGSG